jgi:hypothetical protein
VDKLEPTKPRKPLDPRLKRLLVTAAMGLGFGFGCRLLPEEYQILCTVLGKLLGGLL